MQRQQSFIILYFWFSLDLNCLDENSELTPLGKILAKLPVDPRLGKMIITGTIFGVADPLAIIAAQSSNMSEVFALGKPKSGVVQVKFHEVSLI